MVINNLLKLLATKNFPVATRPGEVNIVGLRSRSLTPKTFDDEFYVFWMTSVWNLRVYKGTTDPGTYALQHPTWPRGTAIVKEGHYPNCWQIGLHRGQYEALVQRGMIKVLIDNNRDAVLDLKNVEAINGAGINLHRAKLNGRTVDIGKWSAGCQVLANNNDFAELMKLAKAHAAKYGNAFSYSLIDLRDYQQWQVKEVFISGVALAGLALLTTNTTLGQLWTKLTNWLTEND